MIVMKEKTQLDDNVIVSLAQWLQFLSIRKEQFIMPSTSRYYLIGTVTYLMVSTDDGIKTTNNDTEFPELRIISE